MGARIDVSTGPHTNLDSNGTYCTPRTAVRTALAQLVAAPEYLVGFLLVNSKWYLYCCQSSADSIKMYQCQFFFGCTEAVSIVLNNGL